MFRIGEDPPYWAKKELYIERARVWKTSTMIYGAALFFGMLYFTDWKAVCQYIPYYNGKFQRGNPRRYSLEPVR
ncbi:cytochrome b-c1 complex subunit 10 [Orussus abietinus]|uniref:cytochrome b-c1 complex subunit 10 n=1 Tax=Orussus abietinus TaxID=222816 RepID=UPI000625D527|nr:cytochrome b-c1 complex subunit 10 [Orussus abietinus]